MNTANIENKDLPAFACVGYDALGGGYQQDGLSKLEYFASNAQKAIINNPDTLREITKATNSANPSERDEMFFRAVARISVLHAAALIEALNE